MKKRVYKFVAALLALCLPLGGALGALAEQDKPDVVGDLLRYFMGVSDAEPEPITDDDGEYVVEGDEADEEQIVVDEHINVTDLAVTPGLSRDWLNILLLGTSWPRSCATSGCRSPATAGRS